MAKARKEALSADSSLKNVNMPGKALLHYVALSERRHLQRKRLQENREMCRVRQKILVPNKGGDAL